jgi:cytidylate kinase
MYRITIAIDGYSSCGKSTLAKSLASKLGLRYVDTVALYRATTLYFLRNGITPDMSDFNSRSVALLHQVNLRFQYNPSLKFSETFLNGENVEREIRDMWVSNSVSQVSAIREVRQKMVALQKQMGRDKGVVMEGRDIGTNVFPDAELKLFMTADVDVRMQRRYDELHSKGQMVTMEEVRRNIEQRDYEDTHRNENPLIKAPDAVVLDNSDLTREEQLTFVVRLVEEMVFLNKE